MAMPSTSHPLLAAPLDVLDDDPPLSTIMSRGVVTIDAEAGPATALQVMATTGMRHLPVVDRGRCLGVLAEVDLVRCLVQDGRLLRAGGTVAVRHLYRPVPEAPPTARVSEAARHMSADVSDAVLVTESGRVLGIVTATDLVRLLARRDARRAP